MKTTLGKIIGALAFAIVMGMCIAGFIIEPRDRLTYVQIAGGVLLSVWGAKAYKNALVIRNTKKRREVSHE